MALAMQKNSAPLPTPSARLSDSDYFNSDQLCQYFGINHRTLIRWRDRGYGPPCVYVGRAIFYRRDAVKEWLLSRERANNAPRPYIRKPVKTHSGPNAPRLSRTRNAWRETRSRA